MGAIGGFMLLDIILKLFCVHLNFDISVRVNFSRINQLLIKCLNFCRAMIMAKQLKLIKK